MASARKSSRAFSLSAAVVIAVAAPCAGASPLDKAAEVHEKGGYPDAIQPLDVPVPAGLANDSQMSSESKPKAAPQTGGPASGSPDPDSAGRAEQSERRKATQADRPPRSEPASDGRSSPGMTSGGDSIFGQLLLVAALAALVAFVVALIVSRRGRAEDPRTPQGTESVPVPAPREARLDLDPNADADALATAGRLGEAILVLLLRALHRVGWEPAGMGQSSTAREVLAALGTGDPRRQPLRALIDLAEGVRFAGVAPTPDLFAAVRSRYQELDQAEARAAG